MSSSYEVSNQKPVLEVSLTNDRCKAVIAAILHESLSYSFVDLL
jgi:hypothetical protein